MGKLFAHMLTSPERRALSPGGLPDQAPVHRSPGFDLISEYLAGLETPGVLDLGTSVGSTIAFLSQFHCKLYIEHLAEGLDGLNAMVAQDAPPSSVSKHLQPYGDDRFDVILAWDLFNYLELDVLAELMDHFAQHCHQDALLLALICIGKQVPRHPLRFEVVNAEQLRYAVDPHGPRPCPQPSIPDLLRRLPQFAVKKTYLLQNGMQEYVFRFRRT